MMQCSSLAFSQVMGANTNTTTHKEIAGVLAEKGSGGIGLEGQLENPVRSEGEPIEIGVKGQPLAVEQGEKADSEALRSASGTTITLTNNRGDIHTSGKFILKMENGQYRPDASGGAYNCTVDLHRDDIMRYAQQTGGNEYVDIALSGADCGR